MQEAMERSDIFAAHWGWEASAAEVKGWLSLDWLFDALKKSIKQKEGERMIFQMAETAYPSLTIQKVGVGEYSVKCFKKSIDLEAQKLYAIFSIIAS